MSLFSGQLKVLTEIFPAAKAKKFNCPSEFGLLLGLDLFHCFHECGSMPSETESTTVNTRVAKYVCQMKTKRFHITPK